MQRRGTPLAWRNLTENRWRLLASVSGVAFAVVLMIMQIGFRKALVDSMVALLADLDGDVVILHKSRYILSVQYRIPYRRLLQAKTLPGVAEAVPMYVENALSRWRPPGDAPRRIRLVAFPVDSDLLDLPSVRAQKDLLRRPNAILADRRSRERFYGSFETLPKSQLSGKDFEVVGVFELGADFRNNGNMLVSEANFLKLFPNRLGPTRGDDAVDLGILRLEPGYDPAEIRDAILAKLPEDVIALTKEEIVDRERNFWERVTPVGIVFTIGVIIGFIVGATICYQVLFSDVSDRLAEFATLKAMGYSNRRLSRIVIEQALILSVMGYGSGMLVSAGFYWLVAYYAGLPMILGVPASLTVFGMTIAMCVIAGFIAGRKLFAADPAELFR